MRWMKMEVLLVAALLTMGLVGCGADPGGDFLDDGLTPQSLPLGGVLEEIQKGYQSLASAQLTTARGIFLRVVGDSPTPSQASQAWAGIGFVDTRQLGSAEGLQEFRTAYDLDNSNPDARVGLAGCLLSRGTPQDVDEAIALLQGLDSGNDQFVYTDRFKVGITNAEVHAMLAYLLRIDGQTAASNTQKQIAQNLDANVDDTSVDQIIAALDFLP